MTLTPDRIAEEKEGLKTLAEAASERNEPSIAVKPAVILALIEEIASLERYSDDVDREGERLANRIVDLESRNVELERDNDALTACDTVWRARVAELEKALTDECAMLQAVECMAVDSKDYEIISGELLSMRKRFHALSGANGKDGK